MEYSSIFQLCPFRVLDFTDRIVSGQGSLVIAAGPDVSHGIASSDFAVFLGLEPKKLRPKCYL